MFIVLILTESLSPCKGGTCRGCHIKNTLLGGMCWNYHRGMVMTWEPIFQTKYSYIKYLLNPFFLSLLCPPSVISVSLVILLPLTPAVHCTQVRVAQILFPAGWVALCKVRPINNCISYLLKTSCVLGIFLCVLSTSSHSFPAL